MDRSEALDYLDLDPSASDDEINQRFRELVHKSHPDTEGSDEEMTKLIEARDTALEETPTELEVVQSVIENYTRENQIEATTRQEREKTANKADQIVRRHTSRYRRRKQLTLLFGSIFGFMYIITSVDIFLTGALSS